jgi:hypothetical protein
MGMNLNDQGQDFKRPPPLEAGTYPGRTVGIVDLGLQPQSYKGEDKAPGRMVSVTYEFSDEFMLDEDGQEDHTKPRWLSEQFVLYNLETEKAKSTARYKTLDPTNLYHGDFLALVDIPVNITVTQNPNKKNPDRPYENVAGISPMRAKDAEKCPALVNKPFVFDLEEPDLDEYAKVPAWMKKQVEKNLEFKGSLLATMLDMGENAPPSAGVTTAEDSDIDDDEVPY